MATVDPLMEDHLKNCADHATYLSPDIQNHMIEVIGSAISKEIIRRVKEATFFAIIADETPDSGKIEQLSLLVRYVRNGTTEERLLSVEPMNQTYCRSPSAHYPRQAGRRVDLV
ncbi:Hypothetical predicted protein [Paramuricea clavata]|uniref:Uncharacterized protein n=1 Tax=Paramuricea clavata TaxID=317549 RepID=A0A6S7H321_PARCT|nr:Hypothetical predicted protein [Paramuricea clavata]